jgi:hypothetical protein
LSPNMPSLRGVSERGLLETSHRTIDAMAGGDKSALENLIPLSTTN